MDAVIRFIVGVANTLHRMSAPWTRLPEASMNSHIFSKCCDLLRKIVACFLDKAVDPHLQRLSCYVKQTIPFFWCQLMSQRNGRELGCVQNLVRVSIADSTNDARI